MAKKRTEDQIDRNNRYGSPVQWIAAGVIGSISAASTFINLVRTKFHTDNRFRQGFAVLHEVKNLELLRANDEQIGESIKIFKEHVGDHPSFKAWIDAREKLNLHGPEAIKKSTDFDIGGLLREYTDANTKFQADCKEGIDRAMNTRAYKKLAINSARNQSNIKIRYDRLYDDFAEAIFGIKSKGFAGLTQGVWERFTAFSGYTKRDMLFKTAVAAGVGFGGTVMAFNQLNTRAKLNEIDKQSERVDRKLDALLDKAGVGEHEIETPEEHRAHIKEAEKARKLADKKGSHTAKVTEKRARDASNDNGLPADNDNETDYRGAHSKAVAASRDSYDVAEATR